MTLGDLLVIATGIGAGAATVSCPLSDLEAGVRDVVAQRLGALISRVTLS